MKFRIDTVWENGSVDREVVDGYTNAHSIAERESAKDGVEFATINQGCRPIQKAVGGKIVETNSGEKSCGCCGA